MKKVLFGLALVFVLFACERSEENDDQKSKNTLKLSGQWLGNYNDEFILFDIDYTLSGHLIEARQNVKYAKENGLDTATFFYENLFDSYAITINRDSSTIYYDDYDFASVYKLKNDSILILPEEYDNTEFTLVTGQVLLKSFKEK